MFTSGWTSECLSIERPEYVCVGLFNAIGHNVSSSFKTEHFQHSRLTGQTVSRHRIITGKNTPALTVNNCISQLDQTGLRVSTDGPLCNKEINWDGDVENWRRLRQMCCVGCAFCHFVTANKRQRLLFKQTFWMAAINSLRSVVTHHAFSLSACGSQIGGSQFQERVQRLHCSALHCLTVCVADRAEISKYYSF